MASTDTAATVKKDDLAGLEAGLDALDAVEIRRTPVREVLLKKVLPPTLAVVLVLAVWQILVSAKITEETKLPAPSAVWDGLTDMWLQGTLLEVIWTSVSRGLVELPAGPRHRHPAGPAGRPGEVRARRDRSDPVGSAVAALGGVGAMRRCSGSA